MSTAHVLFRVVPRSVLVLVLVLATRFFGVFFILRFVHVIAAVIFRLWVKVACSKYNHLHNISTRVARGRRDAGILYEDYKYDSEDPDHEGLLQSAFLACSRHQSLTLVLYISAGPQHSGTVGDMFYRAIIMHLSDPTDPWVERTLAWWNNQVFRDELGNVPYNKDEESDEEPRAFIRRRAARKAAHKAAMARIAVLTACAPSPANAYVRASRDPPVARTPPMPIRLPPTPSPATPVPAAPNDSESASSEKQETEERVETKLVGQRIRQRRGRGGSEDLSGLRFPRCYRVVVLILLSC
ncbi:hypothetical protein BJV78DRAFT_1153926 [Lactifluus subvellereus]|nr:hypothetical protein BJV78DRAFT_1153926 [Lactifluus subvellereus]